MGRIATDGGVWDRSRKLAPTEDCWKVNAIQYPRLISEMEAAGAFTPEICEVLQQNMDLAADDIAELVARAQRERSAIKLHICPVAQSHKRRRQRAHLCAVKAKAKLSCADCAHYFTNPFDQIFCSKSKTALRLYEHFEMRKK